MGKATRWLKGLLGMKKEKDHCDISSSLAPDKKEKKRWSFSKSGKDGVNRSIPTSDNDWLRSYVAEKENEQSKHAIAVAAATAVAADAAVAAAQAAVAVVRLTSHGSSTLFGGSRERWAAVKIQSFFKGYLARKALRALKALVKIQALVRGYLVRKRAAATLHCMQALIRAQTAVRSQRARRSMSKESRFRPQTRARKYLQQFGETRSEFPSKRLPTSLNAFDECPKIVEIDTYRPHSRSRRTATTMSECGEELRYPCLPSRISVPECRHSQDFDWYFNVDECKFSTAQSTPRLTNCWMLHDAPATPVKSVSGDTFRPYSNSPNYMANTQSSKAKLRSHSAPKQRPETKKRFSLNEIMAARNSISGVRMQWSSHPQIQEYCIDDKVIQACCVNLESQKENLRGN